MPSKRKKNTLSHARGKQHLPQNVWFRRTGSGYRLFVQYYASQPTGTVVSENHNEQIRKDSLSVSRQGQGMSRAAKRRRKKKNIAIAVEKDVVVEHAPTELSLPSKFTNIELGSHLRPFLSAISKPLPLTFRIRATTKTAVEFRKSLSEYRQILSPLPFDSDIFQASASKAELSFQCPLLKELLFRHSQDGTVARQELGSMLPVLALRTAGFLRRESRVIDMCASPGSKTLQALEIIGESGRIVANDVLESRLEALQEAVERSGMSRKLTDRIIYTNQDATQLGVRTQHWADVILCDVPCSGDGTCRKDKHILPMWKPNHANALHGTQVDILIRAIELVKVGGAVCYSTCSLNPVENEAVVAEALRGMSHKETPGVELVDCPDLPGLVFRQGLQTWKVADFIDDVNATKNDNEEDESGCLRWHVTWQDAVDAQMDRPRRSLWPCSDMKSLNLERCARLWPQDQDSGGFFLAIIRKTTC